MKMKVKRKVLVFLMLGLILTVGSVQATGKISMTIEVVESSGTWTELTPFYLKTTDYENPVYAECNATNIDNEEPLDFLQYLHWILNYTALSEPELGENMDVEFLLELNFTGGTYVNVSYNWKLDWDIAGTLYTGDLDMYVNSTHLVDKEVYSFDSSYHPEFYLWRSKSNQIYFQYKVGNTVDRKISAVNKAWSLNNFTYYFRTVTGSEFAFAVLFEDFGYQCGANEGISDPVSNENWGIFEPIRQILLFILNLFMGLIDLILPERIEKVFHNFLDNLSTYIDPFLDIIVWLGANWLNLLVLIHVFLIIRGIDRATKGDIVGFLMPLLNFYGTIFNITMKIINFVVSIIKAVIEALPF